MYVLVYVTMLIPSFIVIINAQSRGRDSVTGGDGSWVGAATVPLQLERAQLFRGPKPFSEHAHTSTPRSWPCQMRGRHRQPVHKQRQGRRSWDQGPHPRSTTAFHSKGDTAMQPLAAEARSGSQTWVQAERCMVSMMHACTVAGDSRSLFHSFFMHAATARAARAWTLGNAVGSRPGPPEASICSK
jgi:hypothetical protein